MPTYYFEIEETTTGWLRIEADSLDEARDEVLENGFNGDIIGSEEHTEITIIDGGEGEE